MNMQILRQKPSDCLSDLDYRSKDGIIWINIYELREQNSGSGSLHDFLYNEINHIKPLNNCREQIEYLRDKVHFNVSQLATILKVKRPTIYEWLEDHKPSRKNHQRLDIIYSLFKNWNEKIESRMGSYFYKKWNDNQSLYDVLNMEEIDEKLASEYISKIQDVLFANQEARRKRQEIREREGFEPVDQQQKERALLGLLRRG